MDSIGPELPPHLRKSKNTENVENKVIGPALPPHLQKNNSELPSSSSSEEECKPKMNYIGPALPPHMQKRNSEIPSSSDVENKAEEPTKPNIDYIGPALPPHLLQKNQQVKIPTSLDINTNSDSEDDDGVYGPLPAGMEKLNPAQIALEERAIQMKIDKFSHKDDKQGREEWMLELPEVKVANLGLGPRQFRAKNGPDMSDRSSWTDTPSTKDKKKQKTNMDDMKNTTEQREIRKRDLEQEAMAKKHKRKKESLVEMHQKKLKNDKKGELGSGERRPFNRETDLQVNRFDEAQKKAVLKKAQLLDDRFSSGKSKFL